MEHVLILVSFYINLQGMLTLNPLHILTLLMHLHLLLPKIVTQLILNILRLILNTLNLRLKSCQLFPQHLVLMFIKIDTAPGIRRVNVFLLDGRLQLLDLLLFILDRIIFGAYTGF